MLIGYQKPNTPNEFLFLVASKIRQARNVIACRADGYRVFGAGWAQGRASPRDRCGGTKTGSDYGEAQSGTRMRNDLVKNPVTTQPGNFLGSPMYGSIYSSHDRSKGEPIPRLTRTTNTRQTVSLQAMTGEMRPGVLHSGAKQSFARLKLDSTSDPTADSNE